MNTYFKNLSNDYEFTGLNIIVGAYSIHLLECEAPTMMNILRHIEDL